MTRIARALGWVGVLAMLGCPSKGDGGAKPSPSASAALGPLALDELAAAVKDSNCSRNDAAKVSPELEAALAALPSPIAEKTRKRFGFDCWKKPAALVVLDYGDEASAKRAVLHYAHLFCLPADPTAANALPQGDIVRRGGVVAIVAGQATMIGHALRKDRGFVAAMPGFPLGTGTGAGSALPFVSKPGAFTAVRQAKDYDYGCNDKNPVTVRACADLDGYDQAKGEGVPKKKPETYVGACVAKPWPTPKAAVEEACWLLWSPFGIEVGTVKALGVSLDGVALDALRAKGAAALPPAKAIALRNAILERGPGRPPEYVDSSDRALSEDGKESISVRATATDFTVVRATNDRTKSPLLVAGFARAGGLGP